MSCPTKYFHEASSISFWPSVRYGLGVLQTAWQYLLQKRLHVREYAIFSRDGRKLLETDAE